MDTTNKIEGKITLLNGKVIDGYPLEEPQQAIDNNWGLDTSGQYLAIGNRPLHRIQTSEEQQAEAKLFTDNAFLFLANSRRILSDSRMFLAPIAIQSGLAYTGTSGFRHPTLGIYIEWWQCCLEAVQEEPDGKRWLVCKLAGSPLTGCNMCDVVNDKGRTKHMRLRNFFDAWRSFMSINQRYDEAKTHYQAYSLLQVLAIFEQEGRTVIPKKDTIIFFLDRSNIKLNTENQRLQKYLDASQARIHKLLLQSKTSELQDFVAQYREKEVALNVVLDRIRSKRQVLRRQLKSGEIDNIVYQKRLSPLNIDRKERIATLRMFVDKYMQKFFPNERITFDEVIQYINSIERNGTDL